MNVTITQISRKERTSARTGKPYTSLGLRVQEYGEKWLSGFDNAQTKGWKAGDTVEITIEEKNGYLNFSVPKTADRPAAPANGGSAEVINFLTFKVMPELVKIHADLDALYGILDQRRPGSKHPEYKDYKGPTAFDEPQDDANPFGDFK